MKDITNQDLLNVLEYLKSKNVDCYIDDTTIYVITGDDVHLQLSTAEVGYRLDELNASY